MRNSIIAYNALVKSKFVGCRSGGYLTPRYSVLHKFITLIS